jgi:hypothetical protein
LPTTAELPSSASKTPPPSPPFPHTPKSAFPELSKVTFPGFTCATAVVSRNSVELRPSRVVAFIA